MRRLMLILILIGALSFSITTLSYAAPPAQGGVEVGTGDTGDDSGDTGDDSGDTGDDSGDDDKSWAEQAKETVSAVVNNITRHILVFPVSSMQKAVEMILGGMLKGSASEMSIPFHEILGATVLSNPGIRQAGSGIWQGVDIFVPTWNFTAGIAVALWPAVLALMMMIAAKNVILAADWGIGDIKEIFSNWIAGALMSGSSLYIADLANRGSNALTDAILGGAINVGGGSNIDVLINVLTVETLGVLVGAIPLAGILLGFILLTLGFTLLMTLVFQYVARFALLYIIVSLLPIVFILGILPPLRWLQWMFVRGLGMVLLIGPINALLLKLSAVLLASATLSATGPGGSIIRFVIAGGVVSVLLTIDFAIIKGVFGAIGMVIDKGVGMAKSVASAGATVATAGIAGAGAAGASLGIGGGGGGGAFNLGALKSGLNAASSTERQNAIGAGMSAAGRVLSRGSAGTAGRLLGSGMEGVGQANTRAAQAQQRAQGTRQTGNGQGQHQGDPSSQTGQVWGQGRNMVKQQHPNVSPGDMRSASKQAHQSVAKAQKGGQSLDNMAAQSGYSGAGATERFVAGRIESNLASRGQLKGARAFTPNNKAGIPKPKDTPDLWDFDRGQQLSDALGMNEGAGTSMALLYHGLRSEGKNPTDGNKAAEGFYKAVGNIDTSKGHEQTMTDARSALESYGKQAGLSAARISQLKSRIK